MLIVTRTAPSGFAQSGPQSTRRSVLTTRYAPSRTRETRYFQPNPLAYTRAALAAVCHDG